MLIRKKEMNAASTCRYSVDSNRAFNYDIAGILDMINDIKIPSYRTNVQGLEIHYKCAGEGMPLVLVHGDGNDWHEWKKNIGFLSQYFCVYAPDLPGYGLSQHPDIAIYPSWGAAFLSDFMKSLDIANAHVIGHSMGGLLSLHLALAFPEKVNRLILIDSAGFGELSKSASRLLMLIRLSKRLFRKEKSIRHANGPGNEWIITEELSRLEKPTAIIWGEKDFYLPLSQGVAAHHAIKGAQLFVFPRCHHAPQREDPEKFHEILRQFLVE
jgi:pimeloyl-ACP methyl ester carboxylesterase